jgi:LPS-assembly lipoprotein
MKRFPLPQSLFKTLPAALLAVAALALSGCGFTPLYGPQSVTKGLSAIEVVAPPGRAGYLLREKLDDAFARDVNVLPSHRLIYTLEERRYARGVRVDNVANRYELNLTANWRLMDSKTGLAVRAGSTSATPPSPPRKTARNAPPPNWRAGSRWNWRPGSRARPRPRTSSP